MPTKTPSPTPDPTANWKTYDSTLYTIKYPPYFKLDDTPNHGSISNFASFTAPGSTTAGSVIGTTPDTELKIDITTSDAEGLSLLDFIKDAKRKAINPPAVVEENALMIDNVPATTIKDGNLVEFYFLIKNNVLFAIWKMPVNTKRQNEFEQILSTFKFD